MSHSEPLVLPYADVLPVFGAPPAADPRAAVLGRVTIGRGAVLGAFSVIRADGHDVTIGDDFWLGEHGTVHIAHDVYPTHIGDHVTAGTNAIIHACELGSNCVLERDAVILDGSKVGDDLVLAQGALVYPRTVLEGGWLYAGQPAQPVRRLTAQESRARHAAVRAQPGGNAATADRSPTLQARGFCFLAATATLAGALAVGEDVGIWFGCHLDGGTNGIRAGDRTNIQDNTMIRSAERAVTIGEEATIGHNVTLTDCTVGDRSLVGMGAVVAPGTVIGSDILLAAGARTAPGQVLDSGWLYGGNPARQLARLDDRKRKIIQATWPVYVAYARRFEQAQQRQAAASPPAAPPHRAGKA